MLFRSRSALLSTLFGGTAWVLASCATVPPPAATAAASAAASAPVGAPASSASSATVAGAAPVAAAGAGRPPGAAAAPGAPRAFADVIKDAKQQTGLFTVWTKDEKVWLEIKPEQFDHLY